VANQLSLFGDSPITPPPTEGIKYAGSKLKILPRILELAKKTGAERILDGFAGTTRVSQAFAKQGYSVFSNDTSVWSEVFATCYLLNERPQEHYQELIDHLNSVKPFAGWFTKHYGGTCKNGSAVQDDGLKKPWQKHNTEKLDGIRQEIENLSLGKIERAVALTSLVLALDRVDNTLGHFVSYLKDWSPRSYKNLRLRVPEIFPNINGIHKVYRQNILQLAPSLPVDLAYFDPPYGSNNEKMPPSRVRYASYYHLWASVCLYDQPELFGKAQRRKDTSDKVTGSIFEDFRKDSSGSYLAVSAIEQLIKSTQAEWIMLSYNSGGRATAEELNEVVRRNGHLEEVVELDHKRNVMANMKWTGEWLRDAEEPNREFLFLIHK